MLSSKGKSWKGDIIKKVDKEETEEKIDIELIACSIALSEHGPVLYHQGLSNEQSGSNL